MMRSVRPWSKTKRKVVSACLLLLPVVLVATVIFQLQSGPASAAQLFSDGFESGNFSQWSTVTITGDGSAAVQSGVVRTGSYAARFSASANAGSSAFARKGLQPQQPDVRADGAFNVQTEGAPGGNVPFLRFFDTSGNRLVSLYRQNANGGLWVKHSNAYFTTNQTIALNTWYDLGIRAKVGAAGAGTVEIWLNGQQVYATSTATLGTAPTASVQIGNETAAQAFALVADNVSLGGPDSPPPTTTPPSTPTPTSPPASTPTRTPTPASTPTRTPTPVVTPTRTPSPVSTPTRTPTRAPTPTRTPAPTPAPASFSFGASGDLGATSNTSAVLNAVKSSGSNFFLAVGDLSYSDVRPESAWCNFVKARVGDTYPFELLSGNHEDDGPDGLISRFDDCLPHRLGNLSGTYGKQFYFDYPANNPLARFINISPNLTFPGEGTWSYDRGSARYNWTASAIDQARSAGIKWVIVSIHKHCIAMISGSCQIGPDILNLLIQKKVDLYLQGHDHVYSRGKQLAHRTGCSALSPGSFDADCVVDNGSDGQYSKGAGTIIVSVAAGGKSISSVNTNDSEAGYHARWMGSNANPTYGFLKVTVSNTRLTAQYIRGSGGSFTDTFTIQ
jgi:Calcineurin-like phosphoesterase